jgi:hypothetical protein
VCLVGVTSCVNEKIINCPLTIEPSNQVLDDTESIKQSFPALYTWIDKILVREAYFDNQCQPLDD